MSAGWSHLADVVTAAAPAVAVRVPDQRRDRTATLQDGRIVTATTADATPQQATGLPAVYSSIRLITHTIDQLPLVYYPAQAADPAPLPAWLRYPERYGCDYPLHDLVELLVTAQATRGAAYLMCTPLGSDAWRIEPLDPESVSVQLAAGRRTFRVDGTDTPQVQVYPWERRRAGLLPMPFLLLPGQAAGVGPLQAARHALGGYLSVDSYAASMFDSGRAYSGGYLTTEQDIDEATAEHYQAKLVERNADPLAPPLVLGSGLSWENSLLDPATVQWIEARQWNATEVCRMYGVPPRYLGLPSGDATTYATARDNDAQLLRTCVSGYTNTIASGLSRLLPTGRGAAEDQRVGFDFDAWLGTPADAAPPTLQPGQEVPQ